MNMSAGLFSPKYAKPIPTPPLVEIESDPAIKEATFRATVRGERSVKELAAANTRGVDVQGFSPADVAEGIINLKHDPSALSEWANFILATSDGTRVRGADADYWDRLLSGIWELALGSGANVPIVALAYAIRARQSLA